MIYKVQVDALGRKLLRAADAAAEEFLAKTRTGAEVHGKLGLPRNAKFHRKFFAAVNYFAEQSGLTTQAAERNVYVAPIIQKLLEIIKIRSGHFYEIETPSGKVLQIPMSISFSTMNNEEFKEFYSRALAAMISMMPSIADGKTEEEKKKHLEALVEEFCQKFS